MNNIKRKILSFLIISLFLVVDVFGVGITKVKAEDSVDKIENKIEDVKDDIKDTTKDLNTSQSLLTQKQIEANRTQVLLQKTQTEIQRKEAEVENLNNVLLLDRKILANYLRELYLEDQAVPLMRIVLTDYDTSDIYGNWDNLLSSKQKMVEKIQEIKASKEEITKTKEELAEKKDEHAKILVQQKNQQVAIKADISESMATLGELQQKLSELQGDLLALTGRSYNAKDIKEAVEFASGKTGVPRGVLYGFLKMETNLGANTGQCTYAQVEKVSITRYKKYGSKYKASIALLYKRRDLFYDIVKSLGYSKDKKVSCSPNYIGQGGAMGVSQFMSDTWNAYSSQISSQTGHSKPNPWDLTDGVMGLALKVKKAGATSDSASAIKKASINYLGAFNNNYYSGILYWSKNYKTLFD